MVRQYQRRCEKYICRSSTSLWINPFCDCIALVTSAPVAIKQKKILPRRTINPVVVVGRANKFNNKLELISRIYCNMLAYRWNAKRDACAQSQLCIYCKLHTLLMLKVRYGPMTGDKKLNKNRKKRIANAIDGLPTMLMPRGQTRF